MIWIIVDVVLAVLSLALLAVLGLQLWRRVKRLGRAIGAAGAVLDQTQSALDQVDRPTHAARH